MAQIVKPRWIDRSHADEEPSLEPPEPTPEEAAAEPTNEGVSSERFAEQMADAFEAEPTNDREAAADANEVEQIAFELLAQGSEIEGVTCRDSMCRLTSVQRDTQAYQEFAATVLHSDACRECFYAPDGVAPDGRPRQVLYLARKGSMLPRPQS